MRIILDKKSNVYAPILLVVCCLASTSQGEPTTCSSDVWFGSKCHFRCRCDPPNSGCDQVTGHCPHKCLSGWFGPGCQYRMATSGLPAWATDGDPGTCNSNASRVLTARFLPPIRLAWLVLSASSEEKLKATSVQYFEQGGPTAYCRRNTLVSAPNSFGEVYTTQVSCSARSFVSSIVIIGDGTDYLCSIEISLGRNVALKQRIFYRGPDSTAGLDPGSALASASSVVDGITWPVSAGSCLPFSARPDHSELYLVLDSALDLTSIHFYLVNASDSKCCNDVEDSFGLTFFGSKFLELDAKFTVKSHSDEPQLKFFLHEMPLVYMIVVENLKQSNSLYICEIEVYGECPRGKFGSQCGSNCNCESNSSCSLMGQCDGECPPGFQGDGCTSKCDNRTFGPDCKLPCSPFCKERRCDRVNGTCTKGCDHDFEPPYCLKAKKDERKAQRGEMEYPLEQDDLTTTIVAAGLVSTLLFIFVLSCNVYLAITSAPRDMSISVSSTSSSIDQNFQFLTYYDVKRGELRKKPSWGSNICDAGEDEDMRNVALTSSMAINSQAGVRHFWRETTV